MRQSKKIVSINLEHLVAHPDNPNHMTTTTFGKLKSHIERTGNYEPIIVRPHPKQSNCFEILSGHHRVKVLKELGHESADCVMWQVDDTEALVLLATLNRLSGNDDVHKKSALLKNLNRRFDTRQLSRMLADSTKSIQRLTNLNIRNNTSNSKAFLNPVTFFLTDEQKAILDTAITAAAELDKGKTSAQRRVLAIVKIARSFINTTSCKKVTQ